MSRSLTVTHNVPQLRCANLRTRAGGYFSALIKPCLEIDVIVLRPLASLPPRSPGVVSADVLPQSAISRLEAQPVRT